MDTPSKVGPISRLILGPENVNLAIAVYHHVEDGTASIMHITPNDDQFTPLSSFGMDPRGDDKMLVGKSRNVGSLVQLLGLLCGKPFYKMTNDHLTNIGLELFVRCDHLDDLRFKGYHKVAGPMGY